MCRSTFRTVERCEHRWNICSTFVNLVHQNNCHLLLRMGNGAFGKRIGFAGGIFFRDFLYSLLIIIKFYPLINTNHDRVILPSTPALIPLSSVRSLISPHCTVLYCTLSLFPFLFPLSLPLPLRLPKRRKEKPELRDFLGNFCLRTCADGERETELTYLDTPRSRKREEEEEEEEEEELILLV